MRGGCKYENLTGSGERDVLRELNVFLGLDPAPEGADRISHENNKKILKKEGWPMAREEYEQLVVLARKDGVR